MLLIQTGCFVHLFICIKKYKKVFEGKIEFLSHFFIDLTIMLLLIICTIVYAKRDSIKEYEVGNKQVTTAVFEQVSNSLLIGLIALSILFEFFKIVKEIIIAVSNKLKKRKIK